uniref:Uncharacterized protein n=1 Tax=Eutreptiella gymnastica TaxID=73025 RepID=A0A7S1NEI0_9EUGL|mmetsp:Transcript_23464/g.42310  ORF Transcript_23464/g.42310 Transcript_23464/m.42310 type:complete len:245 (+) Transcript_23464:126-860(+)
MGCPCRTVVQKGHHSCCGRGLKEGQAARGLVLLLTGPEAPALSRPVAKALNAIHVSSPTAERLLQAVPALSHSGSDLVATEGGSDLSELRKAAQALILRTEDPIFVTHAHAEGAKVITQWGTFDVRRAPKELARIVSRSRNEADGIFLGRQLLSGSAANGPVQPAVATFPLSWGEQETFVCHGAKAVGLKHLVSRPGGGGAAPTWPLVSARHPLLRACPPRAPRGGKGALHTPCARPAWPCVAR